MRNVCGCMPTISAATLIMYRGLSSIIVFSRPRAGTAPTVGARERAASTTERRRQAAPASVEQTGSSECLLPRVLSGDLLELLDRLLLGLREFLRHGQVDAGDHVALAGALELRRAAAADPQQLPVLGPGGNLQRHRAVGSRHLDGRAERSLGEGHGHVDLEVGLAAAAVELRRLDTRDDVEVPGRTAAVAGLALAAQLDSRAVLHARRNLDPEPARAALAARPPAVRARVLDDRPVAAAARARLREREQPLRPGDDAASGALRADRRHRAA